MRTIVLLAALAFANGCALPGSAPGSATGGPMEFRTVTSGAYASSETATAAVAANEGEYARLWQSLIGNGTAPPVDFTIETAVFLLGGQRNTGGYSVEVRGVSLEGETLVVDGEVQAPPPGSITTQALTSPYRVLAVRSRGVRDARWR